MTSAGLIGTPYHFDGAIKAVVIFSENFTASSGIGETIPDPSSEPKPPTGFGNTLDEELLDDNCV